MVPQPINIASSATGVERRCFKNRWITCFFLLLPNSGTVILDILLLAYLQKHDEYMCWAGCVSNIHSLENTQADAHLDASLLVTSETGRETTESVVDGCGIFSWSSVHKAESRPDRKLQQHFDNVQTSAKLFANPVMMVMFEKSWMMEDAAPPFHQAASQDKTREERGGIHKTTRTRQIFFSISRSGHPTYQQHCSSAKSLLSPLPLPSMPSSTLSMSGLPSSDPATSVEPICEGRPAAASSRGFLLPPKPTRAKAEKIGFLHLPDNIRKRIYELAVYDHDRTAVFLPRGLPRKVEPHIDDVDLILTELVEHPERLNCDGKIDNTEPCHWTTLYRPVASDDSAAAGSWVEPTLRFSSAHTLGMPTHAVYKRTADDLNFINDESEDGGEESESGPEASVEAQEDMLDLGRQGEEDSENSIVFEDASELDLAHGPNRIKLEEQSESDASESSVVGRYSKNDSILDIEGDESEDDEDHDSENSDDIESHDTGACGIFNCPQCSHRSRFFGGIQAEVNPEKDSDDIERYDSEELTGMLYEIEEPGILLACKEIRAQCLPVYYTHNAFSWRFSWTDYQRTCHRFKKWLKSVGPDHIRLITKITLQGRHRVEEGIEFSADIDLLDDYPYFETNVYIEDEGPELWTVAETINREMSSYFEIVQPFRSVICGMHR
ncbi:uncharacterized protein MYCFIDRAFT_174151 [Pseudocercospora fijiensis CIRAD86]|uniref:Uncharacterized protein n=1 Tax=Pseudocercospora fijiensis (strain CIRAD86) TaxID=383855 RepID=M3AZF3_PSEFD|nr:uncharacterized protein MYCFIDRAFT_174151 [Pseudocercospora fijiensis CIRAD86]EME82587.1 hypothetical protein MYCFIDRAFT_174151 [Pseudocercospora fijiensis CIRAD86]